MHWERYLMTKRRNDMSEQPELVKPVLEMTYLQ